jgi:hypothetical protein
MMRKFLSVFSGLLLIAGMGLASPGLATAADVNHNRQIVRANPVGYTPHVLDGIVFSVVEAGDMIILGGSFTRVQASTGGPELTRNRIVAFNKNTGAISNSFAPNFNSTVRSLVVSADGQSVYAGGQFGTLNGASVPKVTRLALNNGARINSFNPGQISSVVHDMKLVGSRLFIAGEFDVVGGQQRSKLAELDPSSGALRPAVNFQFIGGPTGSGDAGVSVFVHKFDVTPNGATMFITGHFATVNGADRNQIAKINLAGTSATVDQNWHTDRYDARCNFQRAYYVNDLDFAPDGSHLAVSTFGGYGSGPPSLCDSMTRWETAATGQQLNPTWVNWVGGDSIYAVENVGTHIYFGGHNRWTNNPFVGDASGPGAENRQGIGVVNAANGMALAWNPGRDRGRGVFDLLATPTGLWAGSDTDRIAGGQYRARIAYFPLAGGYTMATANAPTLPVDVIKSGAGNAQQLYFDGNRAVPGAGLPSGNVAWDGVRGGFAANGSLYLAMSDGTMQKRSFNGAQIGAAEQLNLRNLNRTDLASFGRSNSSYKLANLGQELQGMTGLFYSNGRMYYTVAGQRNLFMRYFELDTDTIGAQQHIITGPASGVDWSNVRGMFLAGNTLYWASADGNLNAVNWNESAGLDGRVSGSTAVVSGPGRDSTNWAAQSLIARTNTSTPPPTNQAPVAAFSQVCNGLTCVFDGTGSSDPDGAVVSYDWRVASGPSATGEVFSHSFAQAGSYGVTLTVTDAAGATGSVTRTVTVTGSSEPDPSANVAFVGSVASSNTGSVMSHSVQLPAQVAPGDVLVAAFSTNSGTVALTAPTGWSVAAEAATTSMRSVLYSKVATAQDAGATVTVGTASYTRGSLAVTVYRGAQVSGASFGFEPETVSRANHTTPVMAAAPVDWVLSYWADKTASTTSWAAPAGVTVRQTGAGTGSGHLSWLVADSNGPLTGTRAGGLTAAADSATANAVMGTIVIRPAAAP